MDVDTIATLVVLVTTILGSHAMLRRELKAEIRDSHAGLKADVDQVKEDVRRLDDRVYQLAVGMRPLIEQAERQP